MRLAFGWGKSPRVRTFQSRCPLPCELGLLHPREQTIQLHAVRVRVGAIADLKLSAKQRTAPRQALLGPIFIAIVVLFDSGNARRQYDPRLLRTCKDVDVGRQAIRFVERTDADEAHRVARTGVVAPKGHAAVWTANDLLPFAAV